MLAENVERLRRYHDLLNDTGEPPPSCSTPANFPLAVVVLP